MKPAIITAYHGRLLSMRQIEKTLRIGYEKVAEWQRSGQLCEATIDRWLTDRVGQPRRNALPASKVQRIRLLVASGEKHDWVAYELGCSRSTVTLIASGKRRRAA
jgi:hypothetical protein